MHGKVLNSFEINISLHKAYFHFIRLFTVGILLALFE